MPKVTNRAFGVLTKRNSRTGGNPSDGKPLQERLSLAAENMFKRLFKINNAQITALAQLAEL